MGLGAAGGRAGRGPETEGAGEASPNFGRLYGYQSLLAIYGSQAELTVLTNPNAAYLSAGQFGEVLAEEFVTRTGTRVEGTRQVDRLNALTRAGVLVGWSRAAFDKLRRGRNDAAHNHLWTRTSPTPPRSWVAR